MVSPVYVTVKAESASDSYFYALSPCHVNKVNTVSLDTKALEANGNEELRTLSSSHTEMERSG
ncbi:hypothetical protein M378DRAFT_167903 [Amanita muscaria Koide BX008]|uniref:Uncharacterized protein n=1 Tax=Amanita muscaria (strain Koide BX008) TaxID=946122 RepID=A0A0C2SCL2_AMAMK|nr:hypothetical protein M378DRAFT_167903 [Amanita muscaria Koide BX008]